jgi:ketosteroid isomerase-like protein
MEARMTHETVEKDFLNLETQYWQAIKDKDVDAAMRLTDDPCIVAGAQGVSKIDKKSMWSMLKAARYELNAFELKDGVQVRMLGDDIAIVAYKVKEELTVEGKPVVLEAADASTWVRRDGRWLCALHTEALAGDPFGRDRRPAQ